MCRKHGIKSLLYQELNPFPSIKQLSLLPHRFHLNLPNDLVDEVLKIKKMKMFEM